MAPTAHAPSPVDRTRRRRGLVLALGGLVLAVLVAPVGPLRFYWVPALSGLTYLAAAVAAGRAGPLWAPGVVITVWGVGVLAVLTGVVHLPFASVSLTALGAGALLAALLRRVGVAVSALGVATAVLLAGVFELAADELPTPFARGWGFGVLLVGWGVWELVSDGRRVLGRSRADA